MQINLSKSLINKAKLFLPVLCFLFLYLSWHRENYGIFILIAFVPFFISLSTEDDGKTDINVIFILSYLAVFFWIYFTLYWMHPINVFFLFFTTLLSSLLLYIPFFLALLNKFNFKGNLNSSLSIFISSWVLVEVLHDLNVLGFPYFNLGHTMAAFPRIIQWYSITGVIGGTIWILLINYLIFKIFLFASDHKKLKRNDLIVTTLIIIAPIISLVLYPSKNKDLEESDIDFYALHSSIDVYEMKYKITPEELLGIYLEATFDELDSNSNEKIIFWPENALTGQLDLANLDESPAIVRIREELLRHNYNTILITGAIAKEYEKGAHIKDYEPNLMYDTIQNRYFRNYNAAIQVQIGNPAIYKTKKRLVPFSERTPEAKIFKPLLKILPNLAELNFSSKDEEYPIFTTHSQSATTSPIICYAEAYSSYVAKETQRTNSNYLSIILNEGWLKREKVYMHFNHFAICRAIENNRYVIKSSNDGITAIIDNRGEIISQESGSNDHLLKGKLKLNNRSGFFTNHSSIVMYLLLILAITVILYSLLSVIKKHHD